MKSLNLEKNLLSKMLSLSVQSYISLTAHFPYLDFINFLQLPDYPHPMDD